MFHISSVETGLKEVLCSIGGIICFIIANIEFIRLMKES